MTISAVTAAFQIAGNLAAARADLAQAITDQAAADYDLTVLKARLEQDLIVAAGSEKTLGGNEESRQRAFILHLAEAKPFRDARQRALAAELDRRISEVNAKALSDQLDILLAALGASCTEIDEGLLTIGLSNEPAPHWLHVTL